MSYTRPTETKSESHVALWLYAFDFLFIVIYMVVSMMLKSIVPSEFRTYFIIYSLICAIILTMPSKFNHKRRNYQSLLIYLKRDEAVYKTVNNKYVDMEEKDV